MYGPLQNQCSPFLSAQQVKEFFNLAEHLRVSLVILSAQLIIWNKNFAHFSPLHTDSLALVLYVYKIRVW